jgi:hypothetical protein
MKGVKVEKLYILAKGLGIEADIDKAIDYQKHVNGDYCFREKAKKKDIEEYTPLLVEVKNKITKRLIIVLGEFIVDASWSFGRLGDGSCYIILFNPIFEK